MAELPEKDEPCYIISVAARMVALPAQTLRYYERAGLIQPTRTKGRIRLYSQTQIERIRRIKTLIHDMGINPAGVEVVLRLLQRINELEAPLEGSQTSRGPGTP